MGEQENLANYWRSETQQVKEQSKQSVERPFVIYDETKAKSYSHSPQIENAYVAISGHVFYHISDLAVYMKHMTHSDEVFMWVDNTTNLNLVYGRKHLRRGTGQEGGTLISASLYEFRITAPDTITFVIMAKVAKPDEDSKHYEKERREWEKNRENVVMLCGTATVYDILEYINKTSEYLDVSWSADIRKSVVTLLR